MVTTKCDVCNIKLLLKELEHKKIRKKKYCFFCIPFCKCKACVTIINELFNTKIVGSNTRNGRDIIA